MTNPITFTQTTDISLATKVAFFQIFKLRSIIVISVIYFFLIISVIGVFALDDEDKILKANMLESLKPVYIIGIAIPAVGALFWFSIKKNLSNPANSKFFTNVKYTFTDEAFSREGDDFFLRTRWEELHEIKEKKRTFNIFHNKQQISIIDKLQLNIKEQQEIRALFASLKQKVKVSLK